jgi:hypothetical protein
MVINRPQQSVEHFEYAYHAPSSPEIFKALYGATNNFSGLQSQHQPHLALTEKDLEPDVFSFNFGGYSGKFVFDENRKVRFLDHTNIKVETNLFERFLGDAWWAMITPDGLKYYFGYREGEGYVGIDTYKTNDCNSSVDFGETTSTWYLRKIVNLAAKDSIVFDYESYSIDDHYINERESLKKLYSAYPTNADDCLEYETNTFCRALKYDIGATRIKSIKNTHGEEIKFRVDSENMRCDFIGDRRLQYVDYYAGNQLQSSFELFHDYFGVIGNISPYDNTLCKKLFIFFVG